MQTVTFKAPENLLAELETIAESMERSRGYLIRKALEHYLHELAEDAQDLEIGLARLKKDQPKKRVSLETLERKHGLAD
jgi:RHH-type transcriptional regulator, rel operon repressor / antitoxin RelB